MADKKIFNRKNLTDKVHFFMGKTRQYLEPLHISDVWRLASRKFGILPCNHSVTQFTQMVFTVLEENICFSKTFLPMTFYKFLFCQSDFAKK